MLKSNYKNKCRVSDCIFLKNKLRGKNKRKIKNSECTVRQRNCMVKQGVCWDVCAVGGLYL